MGVKTLHVIPANYSKKLEDHGFYIHTKRCYGAEGGKLLFDFNHLELTRDTRLRHAAIGNTRFTESRYRMVADGGRPSVSSARALHLYGFISPYLHDEWKQYQK